MILEGKVAVVTGSSRGIGAATAELLASHGANVTVNYVSDKDAGEGVVADIKKSGGSAILVQADVTRREQVDAMMAATREAFGPIDILVNNANMRFPIKPFARFSWEEFEGKLINEMKASFFCCQAVLPDMIERKSGSIVNVSSGLSRVPGPGFVAHTSAKSALDAFSKALALELGPEGIRVNVVAPGLTETDATANQPKEMHEMIAQHTPMKRIGLPQDVAGAVLYFCTEWSGFVTGTYMPVSGGIQMV